MRDTQKNIKEYKRQLKLIKEKLATAGLLFLVACTMLTTTTFAWVVLSTNPEVKGINTTVSGNGNLEIALVSSNDDGTAKVPEESQVGDSKKSLLEKNITWGNLINLNDDGYGLSSIVLRPATLNRTNILQSPLLAIEYATDGRAMRQSFDFSYGSYDETEGVFTISDTNEYGVRAISSVQLTASGEGQKEALQTYNNLRQKLEDSKTLYRDIVNDSSDEPESERYLAVIADLMGVFLTDQLNGSDTSVKSYIPTIQSMVKDFAEAMRLLGETYVEIVNIQISEKGIDKNSYTLTTLLNETKATLAAGSITVDDGFDTFVKNYTHIIKEEEGFYTYDETNKTYKLDYSKGGLLQHIDVYASLSDVTMSQLETDINFLVEIKSCLIDDTFTIAEMGSMGMRELLGMLGGTHKGTIVAGALKDYEQLTGEKMDAKGMTISAKYKGIPASVTANIATSATEPFYVKKLIEGEIYELIFKNVTLIETADDIYGMSIDLWLRTNIDDSYLVLEGEPVIEYQPLTNNNGYYVYEDKETGDKYYHIPDSSYPAPSNPDVTIDTIPNTTYLEYGKIYSYASNQEITFPSYDDSGNIQTDDSGNIIEDTEARKTFIANLKYAQKSIVTGYDGVNRVWEETTALVDGTSTTQGKGSCFIFYPEDPIEQSRMLKLLKALTVAFIDSNGNVLATASLNSDIAYEEAGKITVPLELNESDCIITENENNEEIRAITALEKNQATMISAVVYLDGTMIENEDVSATKNINGYLNLQFGSSISLNAQEDEELQQEYIVVNASVDKNSFTVEELPGTSNLTVNVSGTDASEVKVNFVRQVNNYQGVKMDDLVLTKSSSSEKASTWVASQTFSQPGTYVLRNVWVDGVEYELEEAVSIEVPGLQISNVSWDQTANEVYKMTSNNSYAVEVKAQIAASEILTPNKVEALFKNEYNDYMTVKLTNNGSTWGGTGNFTTSGTYVLEYLKIDGEIYYIDEAMQKTIHLSLGIYADVELDKTQFDWSPTDTENNVVNLTKVRIYDNKGNALENLSNTTIHYALSGNSTYTLSSALTWNNSTKSYTGTFKVVNPGVYDFSKIIITTSDSTSQIQKATAPTLLAISPFSPELVEGSLYADEYQFAPNLDADFTIEIKNSSTATVVAKVLNESDGQTYYVEAPVKKAETTTTNAETGESTTVWHFYPTLDTGSQDGTWKVEEIYITNVYYDGTFHSKGEGEWWTSTEGNGSYVIWDVDDVTTNILSDIYVTVTNSGHDGTTFSDVFTESLSGKYFVDNFQIVYKDIYNTVLTDDILSNYGLDITNNELEYGYAVDTNVIGSEGYWVNAPAASTLQTEFDGSVDFDGNDTITFRYPGTYTPILSISISDEVNSPNAPYSFTIDRSTTYNNMLIVDYQIATEIVSWSRPDVKWKSVYPSAGTTLYINPQSTRVGFGSYNIYSNTTGVNSISIDENNIDVYIYLIKDNGDLWTSGYTKNVAGFLGGLAGYADLKPSEATAEILNGGDFESATITIDNLNTGDNYKDVTFTFIGTTEDTQSIGVGSTKYHYKYPVASGSKAETVDITFGNSTYTFELSKPLTVNAGNDTGW